MIRQAATIAVPRLRPTTKLFVARTLVSKAPGADPLEVLRKDSLGHKLCDEGGYRKPGVHWVFAVAMTPPSELAGSTMAPNLRTVGIQKVGPGGIDFVMKAGSKVGETLALEQPVSILYSQGKYKPGETAEQWRGDGHCEKIPLSGILHCLPHYTLTGMLVSKRIEKEALEKSKDLGDSVSAVRIYLG